MLQEKDVVERHTSIGILSFAQMFVQIVAISVKTLSNTNLVASRLIKREKGSLPVNVRRSKMSLLKLPSISCCQRETRFSFLAIVKGACNCDEKTEECRRGKCRCKSALGFRRNNMGRCVRRSGE